MSLLEAMIAQGAEDDVIIGSLAQQLRQLGNAVARRVGFAIGLSLGESWYASIDAGLVSPRTDSTEYNGPGLNEDEQEPVRTGDGISVPAINKDTPSNSRHLGEDENSVDEMTPALKAPVFVIPDIDSNFETHSRRPRKRPGGSTTFSAQEGPGDRLLNELRTTEPGRSRSSSRTLSPAQSLAIRRKRIRTIPDSEDDDDLSALEQHAHEKAPQARKTTRTVSDPHPAFGDTANDPIVLSD
jgi:hypothetical protein